MARRRITPALALALSFTPAGYAGTVNMGTPESGVELGLGWDSQRAEIIPNRCIRFAPVKEEGQTIRMQLKEVSDSSELMEQLSGSAAMSIKSAVGSASAQGRFASRTRVSSSSNSMLIRATVDNGVLFVGPSQPLDPVRSAYPLTEKVSAKAPWWVNGGGVSPLVHLTEEARDILGDGSAGNLREFERFCGDSFVSAIYSGAEVIAVMSVKTQSRTKAESAQGCVKAKLSAWGVKGKASACSSSESDQQDGSTEITVDFTQIGGAGGKIPMDQEGFLAKLNELPSEAQVGPQFHSMDLVAYSDLPDWPHAIVMNTGDDPEDALLANFYYTLTSVENTLQDALDNPDDYVGENPAAVQALQDEVIRYRREILTTLQTMQRVAGLQTEVPFLFGLFTRVDPEAVRLKAGVEKRVQMQTKRLLEFNDGSENPNLIKLKLPVPCVAIADCATDACSISGKDIVDYFVARQARRTCRSDPTSIECLDNGQLDALAKRVDAVTAGNTECKQDT
ncbi:MAG: hypothetical protein OQL28_06395 [Sedimenticola sp.]|nr:hypothetical protein [Sedimenticola sp.]